MTQTVDYYLSPNSPWTYLGHQRFLRIAAETGARVRIFPVDLGKVFPVSGGLPLAKRAPQRQAYRLMELRRFSQWLDMPLTLHPRFFPVAADDAARLITVVDREDGVQAALKIAGALLTAVWAQERDIANADTLAVLLDECGLPAQRLEQSRQPSVQQLYETNTLAAIDKGIFGSPSWVVGDEIFWGQDRLDFLQRKLSSNR